MATVRRRPPDPAIPGTREDRTGTAGILRRAAAEIRRRFAGLQRDVLAVFSGIRIATANDASAMRVVYMMTPDEAAAVSQALREALDRWIANGRDPADLFWWSTFEAEAAQMGTAQTVANIARLSEVYRATRTLQDVVFSAPYRTRVAMAQIKSYDHWTGLSAGMRSELSQIIGRAVVDGKNPRAVRREIQERLGVSKSKAIQYAQTDITDTLRQARLAEKEFAETELGIKTGLLWTSALQPFTRPWHASRNGKVYTSDQVRDFYSVNGNRYNCYCAVTEALLDEDGKPILTDRLKSSMRAEREAWQRVHGEG